MKNKFTNVLLFLSLIFIVNNCVAQIIYQHDFGTATFTAVNPYGVPPTTIDANLNTSQWLTSLATGYNSLAGSTGQALSINNSGGTPTYSLSFNVASGFNCDITAFSFWRQRSTTGAQNWTLTVNGITTIGTGTVPTAGANTGTLAVSNPANGLSGTVNVVLQLSGATGTGTFRLDDFTLYGSVYSSVSCSPPNVQASLFSATSIGNTSANIGWTSGNGGSVIVLARQGMPVNSSPSNGTAYIANSFFGTGQQIGIGNYVIFSGIGNSVNVTGLNPGTNYYFSVFEYNTTSGTPCYLTPGLTGSITTTGTITSCFEIESILVDACNGSPCPLTATEGENEMVRFKVGNTNLNVNDLTITWPSNPYKGIETNTTITTPIINSINSTIIGCGYVKQLIGGSILPAGSTVLLVTSTDMCVLGNSLANLTDTIYVIFQKAGNTAGHFANYAAGGGFRTLTMSFSNPVGCSDVVTYDRALLITQAGIIGAQDGGAVEFSPSGTPTYINYGCQAPISPFLINISPNQTACFNSSSTFTATVMGTNTSVQWSLGNNASGTFSSPTSLITSYTPGLNDNGIITLYCSAMKPCASQTLTIRDSVNLTILQLPQVSLNTTNGYSLCPGSTSVLSYSITNPTFADVVTNNWNSPNSSSLTYTVSAPTSSNPETYSLSLTNICGTALETFTIFPLALPTISLSSSSPTACSGSTVVLSAISNTGNYNWNNSTSTNSNVVISSNTTTTGIVTTTNTCGSVSKNYTLTVIQSPTLSINNPNVNLCTGQSATITAASSEGNYFWQPGGINTNSLVVNSNGVYTVTTSNSCFTTSTIASVSITASPSLFISSSTNSLCTNGQNTTTLNLSGSTGSYVWNTGVSSPSISISTPGVYTATVTTPSCGSAVADFTVNAIPDPTVTLASSSFTVCPGNTVNLTAISSEGNYLWSGFPNTTSSLSLTAFTSTIGVVTTTNICNSATSNYTINVIPSPTLTIDFTSINLCSGQSATITATSSEGNYLWQPSGINTNSLVVNSAGIYSVTTSNLCFTTTATTSVTVNSLPTLSISSTSSSLCASGQTATLSLSGSTGTYNWSNGGSASATTINVPGVYTATVTTSGCGSAISSYTVSSIATPTVSLSSSSNLICNGTTATLTAASNLSNEIWSNGSINTNTIIVNSSGTYSVDVSNSCGTASASINIQSGSTPTLNLAASSLTLCPNETATLTVSGGTAPYIWSNSSDTGSGVITNGGTVTVSNTNACGTGSASIIINVININANIIANPISGVLPVVVSFTNNSSNSNSYVWNFGNGNYASTQNVSPQTYSIAGTYTAYLTASNGFCQDIDSVIIIVLNEEPTLIIPNVFTPNNDSVNDVFRIYGKNILDFSCDIFDRWGLRMFSWDNIKVGWDGTTNGREVPAGTYFYIINAKDIDKKEIKKQGYFQLFK